MPDSLHTPVQETKTQMEESVDSLLIVDDDERLAERLARAMEKRGFAVEVAHSVADGIALGTREKPAFAVVDLRLEDGSGLDVVKALHDAVPTCRAIMLTGYGNIATAVAAVKAGAIDYLPKPADADQVGGVEIGRIHQQCRRKRCKAD